MGILDKIFHRGPNFLPTRARDTTGNAAHVLAGHRGPVTSVGFAMGDNILLTGDKEGNIAGWRSPDFELHLASPQKPPSAIRALVGGLDDKIFFGHGNAVKMWKAAPAFIESGTALQSFTLKGHARDVTSLVRTGRELISGASDGRYAFWNDTTGKTTLVGQLESAIRAFGCTTHATYEPDADGQIAIGHENGTVTILNIDSRTVARGFQAHTKDVCALSFQNFRFQRRHLLATASTGDRCIRIWDKTHKIGEFYAATEAVAFSPDGRLLAHGSESEVVIRDGSTWSVLQRLGGHSGGIRTLAFSPMQHQDDLWSGWLVSGSHDGTARVWNIDA